MQDYFLAGDPKASGAAWGRLPASKPPSSRTRSAFADTELPASTMEQLKEEENHAR